jgi:hypothetical protein
MSNFIGEIQKMMNGLIAHVSENTGLDPIKVRDVFNSYNASTSNTSNTSSNTNTSVSKNEAPKKPRQSLPKVEGGEAHKCPYVFSKIRTGEVCGVKATYEVAGTFYCSKHATQEQKKLETSTEPKKPKSNIILTDEEEKKTKKTLPKSTGASKTASKNIADEKSAKLIDRISSGRKVKKNTWGNYEDTETHIVWNPEKTKVIGNQLEDGSIGPLTQEQIDDCELNEWEFEVKKVSKKEVVPQQPPPPSKVEEVVIEIPEENVEEDIELEEEDEDIELEDE